jgi:hypothetical protein
MELELKKEADGEHPSAFSSLFGCFTLLQLHLLSLTKPSVHLQRANQQKQGGEERAENLLRVEVDICEWPFWASPVKLLSDLSP